MSIQNSMKVISLTDRIPFARVRFAALSIGLIAVELEDGWGLMNPDGDEVAGLGEDEPWDGADVIAYCAEFASGAYIAPPECTVKYSV